MSEPVRKILVSLRVNGSDVECAIVPSKTLLEVLREDLGLTGTKHGCELGHCGACTVLIDGQATLACLTLTLECEGREIRTIEGLAGDGELHPLQQAFVETGAAQCGYCTGGVLMTASALLERKADPSDQEIRNALAGNLCRCTGYVKIIDAVALAARRMNGAA